MSRQAEPRFVHRGPCPRGSTQGPDLPDAGHAAAKVDSFVRESVEPDVIQNMLKTSSYWSVWIRPHGAHQAAPLHEATPLETGAHSLAGPALGTKVSVPHESSLDQVVVGRKRPKVGWC
jgi:hypothetical protein